MDIGSIGTYNSTKNNTLGRLKFWEKECEGVRSR